MIGYEQTIEVNMQRLFAFLSEKDKRRYAGIEATKPGDGGIGYISKLFVIDPKTIRRGLQELVLADDLASDRVRKKGGGRKTAIEQQPQLLVNFLELLAEFTAGDPIREGVLRTNLSSCEVIILCDGGGSNAANRHIFKEALQALA